MEDEPESALTSRMVPVAPVTRGRTPSHFSSFLFSMMSSVSEALMVRLASASACARLLELRGDVDGALGLLRRLASFEQSGREPILREIERLQNIRK